MKTCRKCHEAKPETEFHKNAGSKDGLATKCKPCVRARWQAWYDANYETQKVKDHERYVSRSEGTKAKRAAYRETNGRRLNVLYTYNLSLSDVAVLLAKQGGRCANEGCSATEPGGKGTWHIDHDHACCPGKRSCGKCIRGLLCATCNVALGMLGDGQTPERIYGLYQYAVEHGPKLIGGPDALFVLKSQSERIAA